MIKTLFKYIIHDIFYDPILSGIKFINPPVNIEQVKEEIRKCGENMI